MSDKFKPGDKVRVGGCDHSMHFVGYDKGGYPVCQKGDYEFRTYTLGSLELIPEPCKVEGWVNVYGKNFTSRIYPTKREADNVMSADQRLACIYVSGTEGVEP